MQKNTCSKLTSFIHRFPKIRRMDKKAIKKAIISNAAVLVLALIMFVSATAAWFTVAFQSDTEHKIFIGEFKVDKWDTGDKFASALNINMTDMYPMTNTEAYNKADNQNHSYRFQLTNAGTVHAMYRFYITASGEGDADEYKLSRQLKYSVRYNRTMSTLVGYTANQWTTLYSRYNNQYVFDDLLTTAEKAANTTLQKALDALTVTPEIPANYSNPLNPIERVPEKFTTVGELQASSATMSNIYYEICFWLADKATIDSAANKTASITIGAYFKQTVGGANWDNWKEEFGIT